MIIHKLNKTDRCQDLTVESCEETLLFPMNQTLVRELGLEFYAWCPMKFIQKDKHRYVNKIGRREKPEYRYFYPKIRRYQFIVRRWVYRTIVVVNCVYRWGRKDVTKEVKEGKTKENEEEVEVVDKKKVKGNDEREVEELGVWLLGVLS